MSQQIQVIDFNAIPPTIRIHYFSADMPSVANNQGTSKTVTVPAVPSGFTYTVAIRYSGFHVVSGATISGTTLTINTRNYSGGSHSASVVGSVIYYKDNLSI